MRLKVDLSLPNSQHFTIWNKITQGSCSAHSMLPAPPRWKASGWNVLKMIASARWEAAGDEPQPWVSKVWHGTAVLEVVQSLPASAGALGSVLAEKALLTPTPSTALSIFPQKIQLSPFGGTFPRVPWMIGMWFCPAFTGIMQNGYGKMGKKWRCVCPCSKHVH